ncbi:MAG TPA: hypothetical protein VFP36_02215 [Usitatibacter sp.]|nr:hypothetical protein [Usitatibacter sp.]
MAMPRWLPLATILTIAAAMIAYGPIAQPAGYHDFADTRTWIGLPRAADVLSNAPFALAGFWALARRRSSAAWTVFDVSLALTALGSTYYHLAPDDARLVWDRLPIALACAGLLAATHAETHESSRTMPRLIVLCAGAVASVAWWRATGDLRPYLLLQGAPLLLLPLWQWQAGTPRRERILFGAAIACYIAAKLCEALDRAMFDALVTVSGHTLKHLLAAVGAALIVYARNNEPREA